MTPQSPEERLANLKKLLRVFSVLQYAAPLLLLVLGLIVPAIMEASQSTRTMVSMLFCFIALFEFLFFRFFMVRNLVRQIDRLENN